MAFYGEAVQISWINNVTTGPFNYGERVQYLGDSKADTLSAGDDFCIEFYDYDSSEDPAPEFFVVLEVLSGTGSVTASWGFDPDWNNSPAVCVNAAGTHAIVAGINVIPLTGVDAATYWARDEALTVHIEVDSGSFAVDQVRMRIWPVGGAVGGWSELVTPTTPIEQVTGAALMTWSAQTYWFQGFPTWSGSQTENRARMLAATPASGGGSYPVSSTPPYDGTRTRVGGWSSAYWEASGEDLGNQTCEARGLRYALSAIYYEASPEGVEGVDYVRPPDSTHGYTQPEGLPTYEWVQSVMTLVATSTTSTSSGGTGYRIWDEGPHYLQIESGVNADPIVKPTVAGGDVVAFGLDGAVLAGADSTYLVAAEVDLAAYDPGDPLLLTLFTGGHIANRDPVDISAVPWKDGDEVYSNAHNILILGEIATPVGSFIPDAIVEDLPYEKLRYEVTAAPYRYWDPLATPAVEIEQPPAFVDGYFLRGTPNLDGLDDGVIVNFN